MLYVNGVGAVDLSTYSTDKDVNYRILQLEIKRLDEKMEFKIDSLATTIQSDIKRLDSKIDSLDSKIDVKNDSLTMVLQSDNKRLDSKSDNNFEVLNSKIDNITSMKKWVVGMFIAILLAVASWLIPNIIAFFS